MDYNEFFQLILFLALSPTPVIFYCIFLYLVIFYIGKESEYLGYDDIINILKIFDHNNIDKEFKKVFKKNDMYIFFIIEIMMDICLLINYYLLFLLLKIHGMI